MQRCLMVVIILVFFVFAIAVMLRLLPAVVAGLLLLLGLQTVHGCGFQVFHCVDQVLVRVVRAQLKVLLVYWNRL